MNRFARRDIQFLAKRRNIYCIKKNQDIQPTFYYIPAYIYVVAFFKRKRSFYKKKLSVCTAPDTGKIIHGIIIC